MLRLVTLGRIELTDAAGRPVESVLKQPKRLALLAWLAVGGPGSMRSRDTVLGLFWPEQSMKSARSALNQALYVLRQELGRDVVVSVGQDQIGLAPGEIWCDAVAVRTAAASGDHRSVQAHYRGEFLPGFFLSDAPEFEKWLDGERATLRRLASSSAWKLAEESASAGDVETAAAAAVRSAELSLREESMVRRAIELLDRLGERARALDLYRQLEAELAEDFGTEPAPETQEVVARVRAREAAPAVTDALRIEKPAPPAPSADAARWQWRPEPLAVPVEPPRPRPVRRAAFVALPAVAALALLVWLLTRPPEDAAAETMADPHLLIEPFEALAGDDRLGEIAGLVTVRLAGALAEVDGLDVILIDATERPSAESAAMALAAPDTGARAWFIVRGHLARDGDRMSATVSLLDRATGQMIRSTKIERITSDASAFIEEATQEAADFARVAVGRELRERQWRAATDDDEAWRLLERAESDRRMALRHWDDEAMGPAWTGIAQADSLLARAERREPDWLAPTVLRSQIAYDRLWFAITPQYDPDAALRYTGEGLDHAERALARDSMNARAREMRGRFRFWYVLLAPNGESDEALLQGALADLRAAITIDDRRAEAWSTLSHVSAQLGRYQEAYYAAQQAYQVDAFLEQPENNLVRLFDGAFEAGDDKTARDRCRQIGERFPRGPASVYCALTMLAWTDSAQARVDQAWSLIEGPASESSRGMRPQFELLIARILAREGQADSARRVMARALERQPGNPELLPLAAGVFLALEQPDSASSRLRAFIEGDPATRQGLLASRRFVELRE